MRFLAPIVLGLLLSVSAMSVELFRYRGAAKDGGTLEYVFEAGEQNSPNAVTKEKVAEIAADFMTTFYRVQVGAGDSGIPHHPDPILAGMLFGHGQRATATIVLCRASAGWDGCCAERGEAAIIRRGLPNLQGFYVALRLI
jgi:hypothetical protein